MMARIVAFVLVICGLFLAVCGFLPGIWDLTAPGVETVRILMFTVGCSTTFVGIFATVSVR